jgi:hypothetical protein
MRVHVYAYEMRVYTPIVLIPERMLIFMYVCMYTHV